ncbi:MAG TPA: M20/M25/M40 family metallo-hydrolase [Candidatus Limnocylindria bacterium]|nr:M20/M25/M40 family metallo-hydrolase [Candidatus Limnocylindria bacterium]
MDRWKGVAAATLLVTVGCAGVTTPAGRGSPAPSAAFSTQRALAHLDALQRIADEHGGVRAVGRPGFERSMEYVTEQLERAGYRVARHRFDLPLFEEPEPVRVTIDGGPSYSDADHARALIYSPAGRMTARLDEVARADDGEPRGAGGCESADWRGFREGRIALLAPAPCFRRAHIELAQAAGAAAAIVVYPEWGRGEIRRPTLLTPDGLEIPAVAVGAEIGRALDDALRLDADVTLSVTTRTRDATSVNLTADRRGTGDGVVVVGAHLDSVLEGPGINDNGSGVAALLEIATALAERPPPRHTVRFAFWSGEELGVLGSRAYVDSLDARDLDALVAYLNADMLASHNAGRFVYADDGAAPGSEPITDLLLDRLDSTGAPAEPVDLRGGSDHGPFLRAGVPTGGVYSGGLERMTPEQAARFGGDAAEPMDSCYHLACDRVDRVNQDSLDALSRALAHAVMELAAGAPGSGAGG